MRLLALALALALIPLLLNVHNASAGNILVTYAPGAKSHLGSILPFVNRLAKAGHNVTLVYIYLKAEEGERSFAPNIATIKAWIGDQPNEVKEEMGRMIWTQTLHAPKLCFFYLMLGQNFMKLIEEHPGILAQAMNGHWDFVLVSELFTMHGYAIAQLLQQRKGVPYGILGTSSLLASDAYRASLGQHWLSRPQMFGLEPADAADRYQPTRFWHRLVNVLEHTGELVGMKLLNALALPGMLARLNGRADFDMDAFIAGSSVTLTDAIEFLGMPTSQVTDVRVVGSNCEVPGKLPEDYRAFVEDPASKATVYIAFGTFVPWDFARPELVAEIFAALAELTDYRIVFSFNGKFPTFPIAPHIRLVKWAPQLELLNHPKTRVFLTHGGLKSVKESLCTRTPMLVLAMFAEQAYNAKHVLHFGIGSVLNKYTLKKATIVKELREVLENPAYAQRVDKLYHVFLDRPLAAVEDGEFFVSRRIRLDAKGHAGAPLFFKRRGIDQWLWEFYFVDAALLLLAAAWALAK